MNYSKKILTAVIVLFATLVLVSCKPKAEKLPVITGAGDKTIELDSVFDPKAGVKATDENGKDITADIKISGDEVDTSVIKVYTLEYKVESAAGKKAEVTRKINVVDRTYAEGNYNYRFAESEIRNAFFGAAESYLLENVYGGVPLFVNSGMSIYSSRVQLPVDNYIPVMGWGSAFGRLTQDDSNVTFSDGSKGKANEYTYRGSFSSNPTTFNQWISDDSVSSDALSFMIDSLYDFEFNDNKTAYEVKPSMAKSLPTPTNPKVDGAHTVAKKWTVPIKDGLEFKFNGADLTGFDAGHEKITAQTFVDTYKYAIDSKWFRAIAGGSHFWSTTTPIKNAKKYFDGQVGWDEVGIKVTDGGKSLELEFEIELSEWNLVYWLSSNTLTPVHLPMAKKLGTNYGTSPETTAYTGGYYLSAYEPDKSLRYTKNDKFHTPTKYNYTGYNFAIIERAEIIFAEFEAGKLDVAGIPLTKYEQYKNNPGIRRTPGSTTFRMNINGLGNKEAQKDLFPNSKWDPSPILANKDFRQALYFGVDRKTLAYDVLKTSDPGMFLFSNAYLVDPDTGLSFRDTEEGKKVGEGLSESTYGYNPDAALNLFKKAVAEGIAKNEIKRNETIKLEVAVQAGSTAQAQLGAFIKSSFEKLFNDPATGVKVEITVLPFAFPDIYYTKQLVGEFDLGMGGISGSTLDAASFLEVFSSDNRGGFTLNWGFDTSVAEIPVTYVKPGTTEVITEWWSFDAIVSVLNGPVTVAKGEEVLDTNAVNKVIAAIDALPEVKDLTLDHLDAFEAALNGYLALSPRGQGAVTNFAKLDELNTKMEELVDADNAAKLVTAIDALPTVITVANEKLVTDLIAQYKDIENVGLVTNYAKLFKAYAGLIDALIVDLPAPANVTLDHEKAITKVSTLLADLKKLVGNTDEVTKLAEFKLVNDALTVKVDDKRVADVIVLIDEVAALLGTVELNDKFEINAARAAYDKLTTDELKARVTNFAKLTQLEAELKPLVDADDAKTVNFLIEGLPSPAEILALHEVLVIDARAKYDALNPEAKALVTAANVEKLERLETLLGL